MKKYLSLLIVAFAAFFSAQADDTERVSINAGIFTPYTLDATIAYEKPTGYGNSLVLFGEAGTHWQTPVCHMFWKKYFWDGGFGYRHAIRRMKNSKIRLLGDVYCGAWTKKVTVGFDVGIEYTYTFANNWQFTVQQRNCFNFLHHVDTFRNGIMVGLKIPM